MSTFILVHGAWHGAWCWEKTIPLLEKAGHKVVAPDLPGRGSNDLPMSEISFQLYVDQVCKIIESHDGSVILVGHSLGGCTISQAAEIKYDKVKSLIYISGYLLQNKETAIQYVFADTEANMMSHIIMSKDQSYSTVKEETIKEKFYGDCSDEDVNFAKPLLVPESSSPFITPISVTDEKFGRIPRAYISCLRDRAISPTIQKQMYTNLPCQIIEMDSDHAPFFSAPEELTRASIVNINWFFLIYLSRIILIFSIA